MQTGAHSLKLRTCRTYVYAIDSYKASSVVETTDATNLSMFVRQLQRIKDLAWSGREKEISHVEHASRQRDLVVIFRLE